MLHNPYKNAIRDDLENYSFNHNKQEDKQDKQERGVQELEFVSIHVRRTDYLALSDIHLNLSTTYYEEAISNFSKEKSIFSNSILNLATLSPYLKPEDKV